MTTEILQPAPPLAVPAAPPSNVLDDTATLSDTANSTPAAAPEDANASSFSKPASASIVPQVNTPPDPASIPIPPPHGTPPPPTGQLLPEVEMAEKHDGVNIPLPLSSPPAAQPDTEALEEYMQVDEEDPVQQVNPLTPAHVKDSSGHLSSSSPPPASSPVPVDSSATSPTVAHDHPADDPSAEQQRPAKRPRNAYDLAPTAPAAPTPISISTSTPVPLSLAQYRFANSTIRTLRKAKDAAPFNQPVDWVLLQIPHYPNIVTHPMDFGTIERKLMSSNPAKPDLNLANPRYTSADEFIADVRLVFNNCYTFNGLEHAVSLMGKRLEDIFNKQIKHMPANEEPKFLAPKQPSPTNVIPSPPSPTTQKKPTTARRPSAANLPAIRRSEPSENNPLARPKREIHPPPPKDLPYADLPLGKKGKGKGKGKKHKDDGTLEQFRYCAKILNDLYKKQHNAYASFFYDPVDEQYVPDYYKVIKKPMDFSMMKRRLDQKEYTSPQQFHQDFKLMIRNCFHFNPPGTLVHNAGAELQKVFDEKWKGLPPLREPSPEPEDDDADSDDEHAQAIAIMEEQLETMRDSISALKQKKPKKDKSGKPQKSSSGPSKPSKPKPSNGSSSKVHRSSDGHVNGSSKKSSKKRKLEGELRTLSFDEKKELAQRIGSLEESKVEKVIQIIHEAMPQTQEDQNDIEIDMDVLPPAALIKLYDFVIKPPKAPSKPKTGRQTVATGGLKRKTTDEAAEAERIRRLELAAGMFDKTNGGSNGHTNGVHARPPPVVHDSGHSSDSDSGSSGSDSGSESE